MIKVVIVEDKPPILRSIKQKIEGCSTEIKVVGEAINGQLALPVINKYKPDIIFTDIRMPVMDGLQLINEVKKQYPDTQFVIISGYDDFEYARHAMKLGVSEYLLKPVTQEAIVETLNTVIKKVSLHRQSVEIQYLQSILNSPNIASTQPECELDNMSFILLLLCAGPYSNFSIDYSNPFSFFWAKTDLHPIIEKHMSGMSRIWTLNGKNINEKYLLLAINKTEPMDIKSLTNAIISSLLDFDVPITIVVGQGINSITDLGFEAQILRVLLQKNILFAKPSILYKESLSITSEGENCILDSTLEKKLNALIQGRQKKLFFTELHKLFAIWDNNRFPQSSVEKLLKQVARLCRKNLIDPSVSCSDAELEIDEILSTSKDYPSLLQGFDFILDQFWQDKPLGKQKGDSARDAVAIVESYLRTHYSQQLTINDIADMVKLDPAYLSRVFKNEKGISPMEFLTSLRIKKAKELILSDSNLMLKDIATIVGYGDPYYFSRIFKTVTGLSPTEYKSENSARE